MPTSPWNQHRHLWSSCTKCGLCEGRTNVVLARGTIPCDVLFCGEAPGQSEDVLGRPFVGPAGKLLNKIIRRAYQAAYQDFEDWNNALPISTAFTNIIACFPREAKETTNHAPPDAAIKACQNRLRDLILIAEPKVVVCVGTLSTKWVHQEPHRTKLGLNDVKIIDIVHPAFILRSNAAAQGLQVQRCVVAISNAVEDLE